MQKFLRQFFRNNDGNATVEFVLWLPLIMGIIVGAFDLNTVLTAQSNMWNIARDTARRVSTGELDAVSGQAYALSKLSFMNFNYGVDVSVGNDIVVDVRTFLGNVAVIGTMGGMGSYSLSASVTMRNEQQTN